MSRQVKVLRSTIILSAACLIWASDVVAQQELASAQTYKLVKGRLVSERGFSVKPPAKWRLVAPDALETSPEIVRAQLRPEPIEVLFLDDRPGRGGAASTDNITVSVVQDKIPLMDEALRSLGKSLERDYRASHADFTLVAAEVVQLGPEPVLRVRGTYSVAGQPRYVQRLYRVGADKSIIITCTMDPNRIKARAAKCDAVTASVTFR
jgi:hypothetical protein